MKLSETLRPVVEHELFQTFLKRAESAGLSVESLLGAAVSFMLTLIYILYILMGDVNRPPTALSAEFQPFVLEEIHEESHDTKRLRFALPSKGHMLGLPTGQHISFRCKVNGEDVVRSYTPITSNDELGYVDFVIKIYHANEHPKFPAGGAMTQYLDGLKVGDTVDMRGPKGHLDYKGCGNYSIIIREMLKNPRDHSDISLLYANQTENDILLRKELEQMAREHKDRFRVHYTLDHPPRRGWKGSKGFINTEMCEKALPQVGVDAFVFICGPPPMIKFAVEPALKELGFDESQWFVF
eukprot:GSChrysophyteH1.ASY1.ANO1.1564.1 assembled CDS